ncbi:LOB domain-containing protein 12 [Phtheirospermum japonicum]|uniref:LOB domain-containing protein 12 n=1 Tax=Phtheirospermum japonicum TaxID=374723 RepID=A0A830CR39_9LAMI|nr:LOB domain-containing protein 12 [Phtheirospermum japonicum]
MGGGSSPCASCKLLRRRCAKDCIFAPYFPSDDPHKFAIVHKVFGASNVNKMLQELPVQQRGDAVNSLVYEANARARDPVYGCVGAITYLQNQVAQLQMQLAVAQAEILCIQMQQDHDQAALLPNTANPFNLLLHHQNACDGDGDDDDDDKSFLMQNNNLLNFSTSSNANHVMYHDPFKKESMYGHDMVS